MRNVPMISLAFTLMSATCVTSAHEYEAYARSAVGTSRAYAGEVTKTEDASSAFANPAAMSKLDKSQWSGVFHIMEFNSDFEAHAATYQNGSPISGESTGDSGGVFGGPNLYWVSEKQNQHRFGFAVNTPYAYGMNYDGDWQGRYHGTYSELTVFSLTPSYSLEINEQLAIGISVPLNIGVALFNRKLNQPGRCLGLENSAILPANSCSNNSVMNNSPGNDALEKIKADGWGIGFTLGAHFESKDRNTRLAAVYRHGETLSLEGEAQYRGVLDVISNSGHWQNTDVDVDIELPAELVLGASHRFSEKLEIMTDTTWTNWSEFEGWPLDYDNNQADHNFSTRWEDGFRYSIGANYTLSKTLILRGGYAYDRSPATKDDGQNPLIIGSDLQWFSLGLGVTLSPDSHFDIGYAYLDYKDADINATTPRASAFPEEQTNIRGRYKLDLHLLSIQYSATFKS